MSTCSLLDEIEAYLKKHEVSATRFGAMACGDTKFIKTLRAGRRVRENTAEAIRAWMQANDTGI